MAISGGRRASASRACSPTRCWRKRRGLRQVSRRAPSISSRRRRRRSVRRDIAVADFISGASAFAILGAMSSELNRDAVKRARVIASRAFAAWLAGLLALAVVPGAAAGAAASVLAVEVQGSLEGVKAEDLPAILIDEMDHPSRAWQFQLASGGPAPNRIEWRLIPGA